MSESVATPSTSSYLVEYKRGVDYSGSADYAHQSPSGTNVGSDQYQGRNTSNNPALQATPDQRAADKAIAQRKWDQAKEANPDLAVYEKLRAANRADKKAASAQEKALGIGDYQRRGYKVTGQHTDASTTHSYRGKLEAEADRNPESDMALQIDDVISKNRKKYTGAPIDKAYEMLQSDLPAGGTTDIVSHLEGMKGGLWKLFQTAGSDLFTKTENGWILNPKGNTGDMEDIWADGPAGDMKIYKNIMDLKSKLHAVANDVFSQLKDQDQVWYDPRVLKIVQQLHDAANLFRKSGRIGGKEKAEVEELWKYTKEILDNVMTPGA